MPLSATIITGVIIGLYITVIRLCEYRLKTKFDVRIVTILILLIPLAVYLGPWAIGAYIPLSALPLYETVRAAMVDKVKPKKRKVLKSVEKNKLAYDRDFMFAYIKEVLKIGRDKENIGRTEEGSNIAISSVKEDTPDS